MPQKENKTPPFRFFSHLQRISEIEVSIAKRRGASDLYYEKWNKLMTWLQTVNTDMESLR